MGTFDIDYAGNHAALEQLLQSVDRPGDFCTHGRLFAPMPRLEVKNVGLLSFPVPDTQVRALIDVAEQAPYGRGADTLVDTSVRNCWQIDASRVRLGGGAWADTLSSIVDAAAAGIGCPPGRLDAQLYKLLVYETGGFFSAHRDTEKADGMIATLSVSLPAFGAGGELVVRHHGREVSVDMNAAEPSELVYAAFYADCTHETQQVREGYRLSLVFNLSLRPGDTETPREAPDYSDRIEHITSLLIDWRDGEYGPDKLVWVLEHNYSEAGLSFNALKNADAALATVLQQAASRAGCEVYAAILHIEEEGDARYSNGDEFDSWGGHVYDADDFEMEEVFDGRYWLDGWTGWDGGEPPFSKIPLCSGELLPAGALDDAEPDENWINESTGNEGVTLEWAYRHAALVFWPGSRALDVLADAGMENAVAWARQKIGGDGAVANDLLTRLVKLWPTGSRYGKHPSRGGMLRLLTEKGDPAVTLRFLNEVVLSNYDGSENEVLALATGVLEPEAASDFLAELTRLRCASRPDAVLALLLSVAESTPVNPRDAFGASVRTAFMALPGALNAGKQQEEDPWSSRQRKQFSKEAIRDLFTLAWRCGYTKEAEDAVRLIADNPLVATPERAVPGALEALYREDGMAAGAAYLALWRHAVVSLLARSASTPSEPRDWAIAAGVSCDCELCAKLKAFCRDPVKQVLRYPLRKELRAHLHRQIDNDRLDMSHVTERRGRPFTLVCTKNRASYQRRLAEYAKDVEVMRSLIHTAPVGAAAGACSAELARLREAVPNITG